MEAVLRWRGPLTVVAAVLVVGQSAAVLSAALSAPASATDTAWAASTPLTPLFALVALVCWGVVRPTPRSGSSAGLAILAALICAGAALTTAIVGWQPTTPAARVALVTTTVAALTGLVVLLAAASRLHRSTTGRPAAPTASALSDPTARDDSDEPAAEVQPPQEEASPARGEEPVWEPDEAAGAVWLTAADAATGAAGRQSQPDDGGWAPTGSGPRALSAGSVPPDAAVHVRTSEGRTAPATWSDDRADERAADQAVPDWSPPPRGPGRSA